MSESKLNQLPYPPVFGNLQKKSEAATRVGASHSSSIAPNGAVEPIPIAILRETVQYDQELGHLLWARTLGTRTQKSKRVGWVGMDGYRHFEVRLYGKRVAILEHRAIWALVHGYWPTELDHINGVRDDNRLANLREVSRRENSKNSSIRSDNTSGVIGVSWDRKSGKWHAYIQVAGKRINLGWFDDLEDAVAVRKAAEIKYGFHQNHGRATNPLPPKPTL